MTKNKFKIGILGCFYNCHENLDIKLNNWFNRGESDKDFIFSFVSSPFKEYSELGIQQDNTETIKALKFLKDKNLIQYLEISEKPLTEIEARNLALKHILDEKCDFLILLDGDEFFSEKDVHNILYTLNNQDNKFYDWYGIRFKNLFGDGRKYLDNFCPPRIFKVNSGNYTIDSFYEDNGILYREKNGGKISYKNLINKEIPKDLVNPRHYSWLSNQKSFDKILYQLKRWGNCSYKRESDNIVIDYEYYDRNNIPIPEIHRD